MIVNSLNKHTYELDYLIIGAGPAGVQLGYYLQRDKKDYLILEAGSQAGNFYKTFPRHRKLISINKRFTGSDNPEFNMRHDWNSLLTDDYSLLFKQYDKEFFPSADSLVSYLNDFSQQYDIKIQYDSRAEVISRDGEKYLIKDDRGNTYRANVLVIASGFQKPFIPDINGIELADNYVDMSVDVADFENKSALIIGKGNSAFETGDHLVGACSYIHICSPNSVNFAWKTHYVGHLRAVNNNILDTYQLKSQHAVLDAKILSIKRKGEGYTVVFKYMHAQGEEEEIYYDKVLCCTGFAVDTSIFDESAKPTLTIKDKYPELTSSFESVNQPNMYFAGTLTHSLDYRKATSGFIHGFRYNCRALATIINKKQHDIDYPQVRVAAEDVAQRVLDQVNESGAMWQQPGFMCDYFYPENGHVNYGPTLPHQHVLENIGATLPQLFTVTLEYGTDPSFDPFSADRIHRDNVSSSEHSQFLHPIIREYKYGEMVSEHHVIEDLEAKWVEEVHIKPLQEWLATQLTAEIA